MHSPKVGTILDGFKALLGEHVFDLRDGVSFP
jgi:hypothetical protein